jgi:glycosyltransferase involved in cell wall biosynthesis
MQKTILCFMFEFPPLNVAGVYRQIRFANAMVKNGYNVIILTQSIHELNQKRIDESILQLVDSSIKIIRIQLNRKEKRSSNGAKSFLKSWKNESGDDFYNLIDNKINSQIDNLIIELSIDILFCSAPPFSLLKLAKQKSQKFNIPLISDLRDAWSGWTMVPFPSYDYFLRRKTQERKVLKQSTAIISVTNELIERYKLDHPKIDSKKFNLVYNSPNRNFDLDNLFQSNGLKTDKVINIGYSGSFYYTPSPSVRSKILRPHRFLQFQRNLDNWLYRSPIFFFQILSELFRRYPDYRNKVLFHYIGEVPVWLTKMIEEHNLQENVILHGYLSYVETKKKESEFNYLLSTSEKTLDNSHYCLPSKIFNYLEAGKPIIGCITNGPQTNLIENINCGIILNPDETLKSSLKLKKILDEGIKLKINIDAFKKYRKETTDLEFINIVKAII